ncbi:MAG: hypothetical protein H0W88_05270 [Parachlamydiaceae bacterium]|nr:hypothetical protein [Parachlamydiaceae bacterium]
MDIIEEFRSELTEGDIRFRDNLQFELKSEFFINPKVKKNVYKQEFYLFIPNSLQINSQTYPKEQFYLDQTNFVRYKTPQISLSNIVSPHNLKSPLIRLKKILHGSIPDQEFHIVDELKLLGSIFRSALRDQTRILLVKFEESPLSDNWQELVHLLCHDIKMVQIFFWEIKDLFFRSPMIDKELKFMWNCTDEFISSTTEYYLTCLLKIIRDSGIENGENIDNELCSIIIREQKYRSQFYISNDTAPENHSNEAIFHRNSLLNKLMLESLSLNTVRHSLQEKHGNVLASVAAGLAMLIYMLLFVWKSELFVINSLPFIFLAVFLYILKDRMKEGLKNLYFREAFRWFPDYSTKITNRKGRIIGKLNENFSYFTEKQTPPEFLKMRNQDFINELHGLKRQETIIHYKREVTLFRQPHLGRRRRELTTIFRLNIHKFLEKANNALQPNLILNPETLDIIERVLPKIYHLNIIIQNTYRKASLKEKIEIRKFRVVVDKFGIKRVEQIK